MEGPGTFLEPAAELRKLCPAVEFRRRGGRTEPDRIGGPASGWSSGGAPRGQAVRPARRAALPDFDRDGFRAPDFTADARSDASLRRGQPDGGHGPNHLDRAAAVCSAVPVRGTI